MSAIITMIPARIMLLNKHNFTKDQINLKEIQMQREHRVQCPLQASWSEVQA